MDLSHCSHLTSLPSTICELKCLKILDATMCSKLEKLPENLGQIKGLEDLWLNNTRIRESPYSMVLLENLITFSASHCVEMMPSMLSTLCPNSSMFGLEKPLLLSFRSIRSLYLAGCNLSEADIPADLSTLTSLEELCLSHNGFNYLPECICELPRLKILDVSWCENLDVFKALPSSITVLKADQTAELTGFPDLSTKYESLWKLSYCHDFSSAKQLATCMMRSLLQGQLVANHRFSIRVMGCHTPEWFREQSPDNHPYMQLPLNWYNEDILGFAISTVFLEYNYNGFMDIKLDLVEDSNWQYVPQTFIDECNSYHCQRHSLWIGFISFDFFKLIFPEFQLDNWSTFNGTIGVSIPDTCGCKTLAIRPVYNEDVERVPTLQRLAFCQNDPFGQPWLKDYISDDDKWIEKLHSDYNYPKSATYNRRVHRFSSCTVYLKERGSKHARLFFNA